MRPAAAKGHGTTSVNALLRNHENLPMIPLKGGPRAMNSARIRLAVSSEQKTLEALQRRASLTNTGDHDVLLAHPDAIELPIDQIEAGAVFVAEWNGVVAGFAAVLPRADGETELDGLFVEPDIRRRASDVCWLNTAQTLPVGEDRPPFT